MTVDFLHALGDKASAVIEEAKSIARPVVDGAEWLADRAGDAWEWAGDLWHGNLGGQPVSGLSVDDQPVTIEQLIPAIVNGRGTTEWHQQAAMASRLADGHDKIHTAVTALLGDFEHAWTGRAADAARARLAPMADVTRSASESLTANATNLGDIAYAFDEMKPRIDPLPAVPPHKNFVDTATPWDTDTEDAINRYNDAAQRNLEHYRVYDDTSKDYRGRLSTDYGWVNDYGSGDITVLPAASHHRRPVRHEFQPPQPGPGRNGPQPLHRPAPPPEHHHVTRPPATPHQHHGSGDRVEPPGSPGPVVSDAPRAAGQTQAASFVPSVPGTNTTGSNTTGTNTTGAYPPGVSAPSPPHAGSSGDAGYLPARSGLPGGASGAGARAGVSAGPADAGGSTGSTGRAAAGSAAGSRGAAGTPGIGPAGQGRDEDREHQRRYGLAEDFLFDTEPGETVDPRTGLRLAPPTIGD